MPTTADFEAREPTEREFFLYKIYLREVNNVNHPTLIRAAESQREQGVIAAKDAVRPLAPNFHSFTTAERADHELFCVGQQIKRTKCRICHATILRETQEKAIAFANEVWVEKTEPTGNQVGRRFSRPLERPKSAGGFCPAEVLFENRRAYLGCYNDQRECTWARYTARKLLRGDAYRPSQGITTERLAAIEQLVVQHLARQGFTMHASFSGNNRSFTMVPGEETT
jgi:hypothetical protein